MKRKYHILCLLFMLLSLSACGKETQQQADDPAFTVELRGKVYAPAFIKAEPDAGYIHAACVSGGKVWLAGMVSQDMKMDDGSGGIFSASIFGAALFQGKPTRGTFPKLDGYRSFDFLNGAEGYVNAAHCWSGE